MDWNLYNNHGRTQAIARHDDDLYLDLDNKEAGDNNAYTLDINKCYIDVGVNKREPWIIPRAFDTWRDFNFTTDHDIPN
eukprot:4104606-Karenia_brevis.AAC.1